jgi:hypothetical protein
MDEQDFLARIEEAKEAARAKRVEYQADHAEDLARLLKNVLGIDVNPEGETYTAGGLEFWNGGYNSLMARRVGATGGTCVYDLASVGELLLDDGPATGYDRLGKSQLNAALANGRRFEVVGVGDGELWIRYTDVAQRNVMRELNKFLAGRLNALDDAARDGDVETARDTIRACIDEIAGVVW